MRAAEVVAHSAVAATWDVAATNYQPRKDDTADNLNSRTRSSIHSHGVESTFSNGSKIRQVNVPAGDWTGLAEQLTRAKAKLGLPADTPVRACYEAGRDGFWIHRRLLDTSRTKLLGFAPEAMESALQSRRRSGADDSYPLEQS